MTRLFACLVGGIACGLWSAGSSRLQAREPTATVTTEELKIGPMPRNPNHVIVSNDGKRTAVISASGSRQVVMVDGKAGTAYSEIQRATGPYLPEFPQFGANGKLLVYPARKGTGEIVLVVNGFESKPYQEIGSIELSPDGNRFAFVGVREPTKKVIVIDGKEKGEFGDIAHLTFSPDSKRFMFAAGTIEGRGRFAHKWNVIVDGRPDPVVTGVESLQFSPDSEHWAYLVNTIPNVRRSFAVIDGKAGDPFVKVSELEFTGRGGETVFLGEKPGPAPTMLPEWTLVKNGKAGTYYSSLKLVTISPDGSRVAYAAGGDQRRNSRSSWHVVEGDKASADFSSEPSEIVFSPDSKRLAFAAVNNNQSVVTVDGREGPAVQRAGQIVFSPDSERFAYVASQDGKFVVHADHKPLGTFDAIEPQTLRFSSDGKHVLYRARLGSEFQWVRDDKPLGEQSTISPDGTRAAHVALNPRAGNRTGVMVVLEEKPQRPYAKIGQMQFSPDGKRLAYVANYGDSSDQALAHINIDGSESAACLGVEEFAFTTDSKNVIWVSREASGKRRIHIDGWDGPIVDEAVWRIWKDNHSNRLLQFQQGRTLSFYAATGGTLVRTSVNLDDVPPLASPSVKPQQPAVAAGYAVVHPFKGGEADGSSGWLLTMAADGTLYGGCSKGGEDGFGVIFRQSEKGDYEVLYHLAAFQGGQHEGVRDLIAASDGKLYAVLIRNPLEKLSLLAISPAGKSQELKFPSSDCREIEFCTASDDGHVYGVCSRAAGMQVFSITPQGEVKFTENPQLRGRDVVETAKARQHLRLNSFIDGGDGWFYGVAGQEHIFRVRPDESEFSFICDFGERARTPRGGEIILGSDGKLYGATTNGGKQGFGALYSLNRDGSGLKTIFDFEQRIQQVKIVAAGDGRLCGIGMFETDARPAGALFSVNCDGSNMRVLHKFERATDGMRPRMTLHYDDGALFGITADGGIGGGEGVVYRYGL